MSLKKSNICIFFHSIWKNLHLTENFYTDMSVVSVTNMRYVIHLLFCKAERTNYILSTFFFCENTKCTATQGVGDSVRCKNGELSGRPACETWGRALLIHFGFSVVLFFI